MICAVSSLTGELAQLAHSYGVTTRYSDWRGSEVEASTETVTAVLAAMGVDASDPAAALRRREEEPWRRMLPATVVTVQGADDRFWVHVPHGEPVQVWADLETGGRRDDLHQLEVWTDPREVDGRLVAEATFELPGDLPLGYHRLTARSGDGESSATLIVTPAEVGLPEQIGERRSWGFATQLYSVRSRDSWGVGDLTDLTDLAVWSAARLDADFVLVNPLHAAEPLPPLEPSPYLPTSRRFFNPLYLRVERIPEYADLPATTRARIRRLATKVRDTLAQREVIDRDAAWNAKLKALRLVHDQPRTAGRELDYQGVLAREGDALRGFAVWSALAEVHGNDFHAWPEELRSPSGTAVRQFAEDHADEVEFHTWLQWLVDEQINTVQTKAVSAGMRLGTMHDLAVGVHPGGADAWRLQDSYADGVHVGAPPDPFNQMGQDWTQPPWRPDRLEEFGYAPLRELIAAVLRHAGGVRVDHIIGLFRLWWIPSGLAPSQGTYVHYDHEATIGVLALEAHRAGAVVVGEDLGVVEPSAREYLGSRKILGTSILWFERDDAGQPLVAERWREYCLASVTTHALPPTAGYLAGEHVRLRAELDLLTRSLGEEVEADEKERESWLDEVRRRGLLPDGAGVEQTVEALHRYLTLTPARLLSVSLADAVGDRRTQNQPGTSDEYPNGGGPLPAPGGEPLLLEDVMESERAAALARAV